eukprot:g76941.t1
MSSTIQEIRKAKALHRKQQLQAVQGQKALGPKQGGTGRPRPASKNAAKRPVRGRGGARPARGGKTQAQPANSSYFAASGQKSLEVIFKGARQSGKLFLANREMEEVPDAVFTFLESKATEADQQGKEVNLDMSAMGDDIAEDWWGISPLRLLDLSSNLICELPTRVTMYAPSLTVLNVAHNQLRSLPEEIGELEKLTELNVAGNYLECLPESLLYLKELQILNASKNHLNILPEGLFGLHKLTKVLLQENQLTSLPGFDRKCELKELNCNNNSLSALPPSLAYLPKLALLEAKENQLVSLPDFHLDGLRRLDVSNNRLGPSLPSLKCPQLIELFLPGNRLTSLPSLADFPLLHSCNASDNQITELVECDWPSALPHLRHLDMANNELQTVPAGLGLLDSLVMLRVSGNPLRRMPGARSTTDCEDLKKYLRTRLTEPVGKQELHSGAAGGTSHLDPRVKRKIDGADENKRLDLSGEQWSTVPPEVWHALASAGTVHQFSLAKNALNVFAPPRQLLHGLQVLDLSKNAFTTLTPLSWPSLLALEQLRELDLSGSALTTWPPVAADNLTKLQILNLAQNRFGPAVPPSLLAITSLRYLNLSFNQLSHFTEAPLTLCNLETLDLRNNRLETIGEGWRKMTHLQVLDMGSNEIAEVSPELGLCPALRSLGLTANPQRGIRQGLLTGPIEALKTALKNKIPEDSPWLSEEYHPLTHAPTKRHTEKFLSTKESASGTRTSKEVVESSDIESHPEVRSAKAQLDALNKELAAPNLSQAKKFAIKKQVATQKALLIRTRRKLAGPSDQ